MSFEINVIVEGQDQPVKLPFSTSILVENEVDQSEEIARYFEYWPFVMQTKGVLYSLGRMQPGGFFSALSICDSDFAHVLPVTPDTDWIPEEIRENLTSLIIFDDSLKEVEQILSFLLESSPKRMIMFFTRYQGGEHDIICGVMEKGAFFKRMEEGRLYFNTCYIVKD